MTIENNPFEIMGLERLVEPQEADYIGKAALEEIRARGGATAVERRLVGIEVPGEPLSFEIADKRPALHRGQRVGTVTDLIWSPRLERNIGYVWLPTELSGPGTELEILGPEGESAAGRSAAIPFLDPRKDIPKQ
jgi:aminomethyltransferase